MMTSVTQSNRVKIGIRPTIDGRRMGVRESLEEQTMQMAKSVAEFIAKSHSPHRRFLRGMCNCRHLYWWCC